jgi:hypothetical protein
MLLVAVLASVILVVLHSMVILTWLLLFGLLLLTKTVLEQVLALLLTQTTL